jgi:hypothetical protein
MARKSHSRLVELERLLLIMPDSSRRAYRVIEAAKDRLDLPILEGFPPQTRSRGPPERILILGTLLKQSADRSELFPSRFILLIEFSPDAPAPQSIRCLRFEAVQTNGRISSQ